MVCPGRHITNGIIDTNWKV